MLRADATGRLRRVQETAELDDVAAAIEDPRPVVRREAARTLGRVGGEAGADATDVARGLLKRPDHPAASAVLSGSVSPNTRL
ncbi:MAG: HEAT repeat domain-containing protein [Solirubrobacteraceae bacterium]